MMKTKQRASQTRSKSPTYFAKSLRLLSRQAMALCSQDSFCERDVFVAMELNQKYIDLLDEMENFPADSVNFSADVVVCTENTAIKFPNIEAVSTWLSTT